MWRKREDEDECYECDAFREFSHVGICGVLFTAVVFLKHVRVAEEKRPGHEVIYGFTFEKKTHI